VFVALLCFASLLACSFPCARAGSVVAHPPLLRISFSCQPQELMAIRLARGPVEWPHVVGAREDDDEGRARVVCVTSSASSLWLGGRRAWRRSLVVPLSLRRGVSVAEGANTTAGRANAGQCGRLRGTAAMGNGAPVRSCLAIAATAPSPIRYLIHPS